MSNPGVEDFQQAVDKYWHGQPVTSLEDLMTFYGVLAVAEDDSGLFRTPAELSAYVDDGRLVTIHMDLTSDPAEYTDLTVDTLRDDDLARLGYAAKTSGRGADYSFTQAGSKTGNKPEKLKNTHINRLRLWCNYDAVRGVVDSDEAHPDGWVLNRLGTIFKKDGKVLEEIKDDLTDLLQGSEPTVLTVGMTIDLSDLSEHSGENGVETFYPGTLDVMDAAMRRYLTANLTDANLDRRTSSGEATGYVTGEEDRVVGTPKTGPFEIFSIKHPDVQPGLRQDQSWRNYPVSEQTGQLMSQAKSLLEECVFRTSGVETYAIPYFAGEVTGLKAQTLWNAVQSLDPEENNDRPPMARVTFDIEEADNPAIRALSDELRFYYLVSPISDDTHIVAETPSASTYWVNEIADGLVSTVYESLSATAYGGLGVSTNWDLLELPDDRDQARRIAFYKIVGHEFTNATFRRRDDAEDDFRRVVDQQLLEGRPVDASVLLGEFVDRLGDEHGEDGVPWQVPAMQLVQLETLSRAGLLDGLSGGATPRDQSMTQDLPELTDLTKIREHRLESFLDRPMFDSGKDNTERRAACLSGVLIGQISWHQEHERNMGQPLDTRVQADKLTLDTLRKTVQTALDNARVYAADGEGHNVLYPEVVDRLLEAYEENPTEWSISRDDMRFAVALGTAFGRRAMPQAFDLHESDSESTDEDASEATA
ncbi:type I-B CRISPR-associated protein Cas8b/Csh1 [Halobaculum sp. MBLA0147]|uniref:type I-B CRISPR-associated protein Cas8b/Csh1 n=1 Tax=Halobaculum sp. MBLA0147 TaxID=3079934 RepID=UPI00352403F5